MIGHILILGIVLFMISYWIFSREETWRRQEQDPFIPIVVVYFVSKCFRGVTDYPVLDYLWFCLLNLPESLQTKMNKFILSK